jgi:hypothetical protein
MLSALAPLTWDYLRLMSTPNHRRHFGALGATASGIKVGSASWNRQRGSIRSGRRLRVVEVRGERDGILDRVCSGIRHGRRKIPFWEAPTPAPGPTQENGRALATLGKERVRAGAVL